MSFISNVSFFTVLYKNRCTKSKWWIFDTMVKTTDFIGLKKDKLIRDALYFGKKWTHLTIFRLPGVPGGVFPDLSEEQRRYFALLLSSSSVSVITFSLPVSLLLEVAFCDTNGLFSEEPSDTMRL